MTLKWTPVPRATYAVCWDTTNNNTCDGGWQSTGSATSRALESLAPGTYYWQARATTGAGSSEADNDAWWSFTVTSGGVAKLGPPSGQTGLPANVTVHWASVPDSGYWVCWDTTNNNSCDSMWWPNGGLTSKLLENLSPATYYWQVRADTPSGTVDADGGQWWSFTVGGGSSGFSKLAPAPGLTGLSTNVLTEWTAVLKVRPFRSGGWEVDVTLRLPDGSRLRNRSKAPVSSKSAAQRWGEDRERHLLLNGPAQPKKKVPTLEEFAPRFVDGHARANRQKPSGIAAKESIIKTHLIPSVGNQKLDAIKSEDVQRIKSALRSRSPKTVNNVLTVLNTLLRKAIEWNVIERMPCTVRLLPVQKLTMAFHEFDEYERLIAAATAIDAQARLIVLLGGDAGLRCGEIIALEWADVDLTKRMLCVRRSEWKGEITAPKNGRFRYVPLTSRLATALRDHRHLRGPRVICEDDGSGLTRQKVQYRMKRAARRVNLTHEGVHILRHTFYSHLAMRGAPAKAIQELLGHQDLSMTQRYMHLSPAALDAAIRLLDGPQRGDSLETAGSTSR